MNQTCDLDRIDWSRFTGRSAPPSDKDAIRSRVRGKRILLTGAGGYIGSALARAIAPLHPAELVLLDLAELGLSQLERDLSAAETSQKITLLVGSVCDRLLVEDLLQQHRPHIIFHAAACKHVPLMEANPIAAATTNVIGTSVLFEAASRFGAEVCVLLSTDKAVDPVSIMGATKRVAEQIACTTPGPLKTRVLRLANVLGSSGSVAPLLLAEIAQGGPLTLTHPEASRFFLTIGEAVQHLLAALTLDGPPSIFVPDVGRAHRIQDLATFLLHLNGKTSHEIPIVFRGLRPGDKLTEQMLSPSETAEASQARGLHRVASPIASRSTVAACVNATENAIATRNLPRLLEAILATVPEFRPGATLRQQAEAYAGGSPA